VEGRYAYGFLAEDGVEGLALQGTVDAKGTIELDELSSEPGGGLPLRTGHFRGRVDPDRLEVAGEWTDPIRNGKRLPFAFKAFARMAVLARSSPSVWIEYPIVLDPSALGAFAARVLASDAAQRAAVAVQRNERLAVNYEVTYLSPRLISVVASVAQGESPRWAKKEAFVFSETPGGPKRLGLADVLREGVVDRLAVLALKEHERTHFSKIGYEPPHIAAWSVVAKGALRVYLEPTSEDFALGVSAVTLQPKDAGLFLDPGGPLGFLLEPKKR
jgi:hypothetical protein